MRRVCSMAAAEGLPCRFSITDMASCLPYRYLENPKKYIPGTKVSSLPPERLVAPGGASLCADIILFFSFLLLFADGYVNCGPMRHANTLLPPFVHFAHRLLSACSSFLPTAFAGLKKVSRRPGQPGLCHVAAQC